MTDRLETNVQILVHISAPSGAKDDTRYRKQAQAFLGFETARRHIILRPDHEHGEAEHATIRASSTTEGEKLEGERDGAQPDTDQQCQGHAGPSLRALPSLILRSSPQNRPQTAPSTATPPFAGTIAIRRTQSDSWGTPPSVVPDSQPLVPATTNARTESPVRRGLSPQSPAEEPSAKRRRIESAAVLPPAIPAPSPFASLIGANSNLASIASPQLPSALLPSDQLRSRPTRPSSLTTPTAQIQVSSSKQQQQPSPSHPPSPPLRLSPTIHHQPASPYISFLSPPSSHPHPHPHALPHTEILAIHPPPPPTTNRPFQTHLTASLALLAKHADLPKRYQPTLTTRPLRPLERGHWYLDCTSFPPPLRTKMWKFLTDFVGQGRAGWGVWCELSVPVSGVGGPDSEAQVAGLEQGPGEDSRGDRGDGNAGPEGGPSQDGGCGKEKGKGNAKAVLKIYCWGETVPHLYIVLFLATSRMVKGAGARWVDGGGEVVVRMP